MKRLMIVMLLFSLFLVIPANLIFGQYYSDLDFDTLNQVDEKRKKVGYWVELLSSDFKIVKKEKKATYFRFVYYQNDTRFDSGLMSATYKQFLIKTKQKTKEGEITILNGHYSMYDPKTNTLIKEFAFRNGKISFLKEYYKNGVLGAELNYDRKFKDYEYSHFIAHYNENGNILMKGFSIFENGKHRHMELSDD
jgi:hypothetical protein